MSQAQTGGGMTRRRYMQLAGAAAAVAAVGGRLSIEPARAGLIDTATDAARAAGTGLYLMTGLGVADYMSGDWGVFQDDYQVAEAQMDAALRTAISMRDGDERALAMAWNHLENALDVAWIEAQGAAIQPMREGKTEAEVVSAASDAAAEYLSGTVESNVLNHWNAQMTKIEDMIARFEEHEDISLSGSVQDGTSSVDEPIYVRDQSDSGSWYCGDLRTAETSHTMLNGDSKTVTQIQYSSNSSTTAAPVGSIGFGDRMQVILKNTSTSATALWADWDGTEPDSWSGFNDQDAIAWEDINNLNRWRIILDRIGEIYDDVVANVEAWASEAYGALQAGEVDMTDVISPTAMASEMSTRYDETGHLAYAAAGLAALNLSVDYENMMTFQLSDGSTFQGTLFVDVDGFEWEVGETINPSNVDGGIYAAVDSSTYSRSFSAGDHYREAIDGGELLFKLQPIDEAVYHVETNKDEAVSIEGTSWEQTNPDAKPAIGEGETDWSVDLSDRLESPIAEVESMSVTFPESTESETIKLTEPFKITEAYDVESGESVDQVNGTEQENYQTVDASDLEEALRQHREYLEEAGAFESDSAPGGGGGGGIDLDLGGGGGFLDFLTREIMGVPVWLILITGGAALVLAR